MHRSRFASATAKRASRRRWPARTVPARRLSKDYDPDELLPVTQAYAGQVSLLDICLGALLEDLEQLSLANRTIVSLTSARGFPLGEHHRLGPVDEALYAEVVHVPWILRLPDGAGPPTARKHSCSRRTWADAARGLGVAAGAGDAAVG